MNDPRSMRRFQRLANLNCNIQRPANAEGDAGSGVVLRRGMQNGAESFSVHVLHEDEWSSVFSCTYIMDVENIRVLDSVRCYRLKLQHLKECPVARIFRIQEFQCPFAVPKNRVTHMVDRP